MDTLQLKLFISLSQTLNFTKTADAFFVTQPTVSNHLKALEQELGVRLFNRDSRSVSLTLEGQEFLHYADQLLRIQMAAENRLRNLSAGRRGHIHIGMLSSAAELFSSCLTEFSREYPNVQTDVDLIEGAEMIRAISRRAYDLYFANLYMIPDNDSIEHIITGSERLHLFAHADIAGQIDMEDWSTLGALRFVSVPETDFTLSGQIKQLCLRRGVVPDIINYYNRADMLLLAVNSNIGLAILPQRIENHYKLPNVVSLPIPGDDAVVHSVVAWRKENTNAAVQNFLRLPAFSRAVGDKGI